MNTPADILNYVLENKKEADFLNCVACHVGDYSIGEITDRKYRKTEKGFDLVSAGYGIDIAIEDDDVLTALGNGLYVSSFISRKGNNYQIHFLCHAYPESMKARFDEQIMDDVIRYMILRTIVALRLDSEQKVDRFINDKKV